MACGGVFYKRNNDGSVEVLPEYVHLDKGYVNGILDTLSESDQYEICLLENKSL